METPKSYCHTCLNFSRTFKDENGNEHGSCMFLPPVVVGIHDYSKRVVKETVYPTVYSYDWCYHGYRESPQVSNEREGLDG